MLYKFVLIMGIDASVLLLLVGNSFSIKCNKVIGQLGVGYKLAVH